MTNHQTFERAALDAYRLNWTWDQFWQMHGERVRQAEPYDRVRYHRLVQRLLALVVSGDCVGQQAVGDDDGVPWEADDQQDKPHDTRTRARLLADVLPSVQTADPIGGSRRKLC